MHNRLKKAVVFGLSACLMLGSLSGCSKKEAEFNPEAAAVTVNGDEISAGLVKFATHYTQALTEDLYKNYMGVSDPMSQDIYGNGSTMGDMIKSQTVTTLENMVLAEQKMEEYGVELTDDEKSTISETAKKFLDDNGEEVLEKMGATQETVERYLTLRLIQNKMEPAMSADVDTEVSDDEAAQRKVQYAMFRAETEAESESETETGSEAESGSEAATEVVEETTLVETEGATEVSTAAENSTDAAAAEAATEKVTEAETAALTGETDTKTQSAAETETESVSEAVTDAAAEADGTEASTEAVTEAASTEAETEAVSGSAQETETETETETEDPAMVEAKAKALAKAEELIAKVKAGEDFEAAANEVDPDAACSTMTFGSDSTSVVEGLITATEGLDDGTLVETPIETDSGYYVAQVVSKLDRDATDQKKEEIVDQRKSDRISELYTQWKDDGEVSENEDVLAQITFDFSLSQETEASTEAATEAVSEAAESETGSEAATEAGESEAGTEAITEAASEAATEAVTEAAADVAEAQTEAATDAAEAVTEAVTEAETK